jgi:hypothetical protein
MTGSASTPDGKERACARCAHAVRVVGPELMCSLSPALYSCAEERSMPWIAALCFNACGRSGRFFVPTRETAKGLAASNG